MVSQICYHVRIAYTGTFIETGCSAEYYISNVLCKSQKSLQVFQPYFRPKNAHCSNSINVKLKVKA